MGEEHVHRALLGAPQRSHRPGADARTTAVHRSSTGTPPGALVPDALGLLADLIAISVLVCGVYYRRHRRRDMLLAYVGLNVGVLAVTVTLTGVAVATGLGLGLFGVLSIIRLRSSEISQEEVAYYFASLAIGLINGLQPDPAWLGPALSALVVAVIAVADHPRLHEGHRQQLVTVDTVYATEAQLVARLEALLGGTVERVVVRETDLVRDQTVVDVRYRLTPAPQAPQPGPAPEELPASDAVHAPVGASR